ncbi:DUF2115 domain-containing protein [Methanoregula sp.]|uniref:DUF2115 domain-containing protein n=1 Tax=Methanoregula sp. TaxID=2052170 RepID=UPI0023718E85|nr:DUF2115 domain-containing protein [Methanoregula sp.]MDD1685834.1 DUF2115 domain-containing protein [Methanoregula sp.]
MGGEEIIAGYGDADPAQVGGGIRRIAEMIQSARTRGELGIILSREVQVYSLFDLQIIGGRLNAEIENLPSPYREAVAPHFRNQLFGQHHRLLSLYHKGEYDRMTDPIHDRERFDKFCSMLPEGSLAWDDTSERNPYFRNPKNRLFYYLIAAFTMFVLEEPGHPVGMPFPGGFRVEQRGSEYYCLIRDKEKEIFYSICNFCPARQSEEPGQPASKKQK